MRLMRMRLRFRSLGLALLSVAAAGVLLQIGPAQASSKKARRSTAPATKQQALAAYGKLPLAFTANAGQTDARVRYSAQGAGFSVFLTRREAMLALQRPASSAEGVAWRSRSASSARTGTSPSAASARGRAGSTTCSETTPPSGAPACAPTSASSTATSGRVSTWSSRAQNGQLKYEFLVRPGARVRDIRLAYRGAKRLSLDRQGNLRIGTSLGVLTDTRPLSYQLVAGKRVPVASRFALGRRQRLRLRPRPAYDRRYPLVIDPGLVYSTYLGGSGDDDGYGIAVDGAGSAYVTGTTTRRTSRRPRAPSTRPSTAAYDAFVTKLDASGAALVYSTYLGGSGDDDGHGDRGRRRRQRLRDGYTSSADFPTTAGAFDTTYNGGPRRLRDEAGRERRRPRLLDLPGRKRLRRRLRRSRSTAPATPT